MRNLAPTAFFAFIGTFLSTFVVGGLVYLAGQSGTLALTLTPTPTPTLTLTLTLTRYPFWSVHARLVDFYKYYFFQTLSVRLASY